VSTKRIYLLYIEEGLIVRTQKRRERAHRQRVPGAGHPNQKWSMDFVAQQLCPALIPVHEIALEL
jgi:putative transposase